MDGPYRDIGAGFARLSGAEAPRRAPSSISSVEDALVELLRNSRDAGAKNIFVASTLRSRRYREITVIDDGRGVPESHAEAIFEPGVTTRHLAPIRENATSSAHGAGLALHHIKLSAVEARLARPSSPTSLHIVFDTQTLPERSLQSKSRQSRPSNSNLLAAATDFARENPNVSIFHASPAAILATLLEHHIIQQPGEGAGGSGVGGAASLASAASGLGLAVSAKTAGRVLRGEVGAAGRVAARDSRHRPGSGGGGSGGVAGGPGSPGGVSEGLSRSADTGGASGASSASPSAGPSFFVGGADRAEVEAALRRAAAASYLEVGAVKFQARPGGVVITATVHEPEDEYE